MSTSAEALPGLDIILAKIETIEGNRQYQEVMAGCDRQRIQGDTISPWES
ncbi:MAG: hypothetical protein N2C12_12505 [Planctomycetales bacterium]